jgi:hypothetical protein
MNSVLKVISLLFSLLVIASNIVIFFYLQQINNKCEDTCESKSHYLNRLIRGALAYNFIITIIVLILNLYDRSIIKEKIPRWIITILAIIQLCFTGILAIGFFVYYNMIKAEDCECLKEEPIKGKHKYLGVWRYFLVVLYSLAVLVPLTILLLSVFVFSVKGNVPSTSNNKMMNNTNNRKLK